MMWAMMICCAAPILFILLFGAGARALGAPAWIVIGLVVVFAIIHFVMMKMSHKHSSDHAPAAQNDSDKKDDSHSNHDCCH
ncbi:hypothetical protein D4R52_00805 [bacterium]|nr:MAG: hypothetical protein D4R52_00805 [bacterium]